MAKIPTADPEVVNNVGLQRYEISSDQALAGFAEYRPASGGVVFTHTEVASAFEGRGIGSRLAKAALDDVQSRHERVDPACPFIAGYIEHHPEYAGLIEGDRPDSQPG